jgi:hypothetical protein
MPIYWQDSITIVSGLPRSGTSMMMRMLEAGGIPVLIDNIRQPDEDNPAGYYEFEQVKQLRENTQWLQGARGKTVKMVYRLLYDLPSQFDYRVIFMRRNLDEVLASQQKMLERKGKADGAVTDEEMSRLYRQQLDRFDSWIVTQPNFALLDVSYNEILRDPRQPVTQVVDFLGGDLKTEEMLRVVDPQLYRNRA